MFPHLRSTAIEIQLNSFSLRIGMLEILRRKEIWISFKKMKEQKRNTWTKFYAVSIVWMFVLNGIEWNMQHSLHTVNSDIEHWTLTFLSKIIIENQCTHVWVFIIYLKIEILLSHQLQCWEQFQSSQYDGKLQLARSCTFNIQLQLHATLWYIKCMTF